MIQLQYTGQNYAIRKAVKKANEILQSSAFYDKVAALPQMSNTDLSSREIATILQESKQSILVGTYWNPFSTRTKIEKPCLFKVNTYKMSRITAFAVNMLINESILSLATKCEGLCFEETVYEEMENPNVFPWRIGEIAEILTRKNKLRTLQAQYQ
ncbi:hypothetical protein FLAN108750_08540 [Flavobacterium antarcticum]|uniref:hypothetical protein n=1 Tax=Flavobacterium antarcticum TaxID=271155 RepID=UPI0003B52E55|nr:hypothetical protein [Flavobacterium antarcticum]